MFFRLGGGGEGIRVIICDGWLVGWWEGEFYDVGLVEGVDVVDWVGFCYGDFN